MTLLDGATLDGASLRTDVCVIGGGPAGIVVAIELAEAGHDVVVLEAGSHDHDLHQIRDLPRSVSGHVRGSQADARGENRGLPYYPLRLSRVRGIGGSTRALKRHGLRSRPLDAIDFEPTFGEGWPLPYREFASFLAKAGWYCGLAGENLSWEAWNPPFGGDRRTDLSMVGFRHGPRETFRLRGFQARESEGQRWITSAAATGFEVDAAGHVTRVRVTTRSRESFTVVTRSVVLATGGIDNARLLLANESLLEHMGPAADNVGRNFMEHLHYVAGHLVPSGAAAREEIALSFRTRTELDTWLTASNAVVRAEGLARTAFAAVPAYASSIPGCRCSWSNPSIRALWPFRSFPVVARDSNGSARGRQDSERVRGAAEPVGPARCVRCDGNERADAESLLPGSPYRIACGPHGSPSRCARMEAETSATLALHDVP